MFHLRQLFNRILFFQVRPVLLQVRVTFEGSNHRGHIAVGGVGSLQTIWRPADPSQAASCKRVRKWHIINLTFHQNIVLSNYTLEKSLIGFEKFSASRSQRYFDIKYLLTKNVPLDDVFA